MAIVAELSGYFGREGFVALQGPLPYRFLHRYPNRIQICPRRLYLSMVLT